MTAEHSAGEMNYNNQILVLQLSRMFHIPEHYHNLSLRLSEVLDYIAVNERMVKMRRRLCLLTETQFSLVNGFSVHIFGSQSEGTTTIGLNSDIDQLESKPQFIVIQTYKEWKPGFFNLLMIQDDITSPGYCHLQLIRPEIPLPVTEIHNEHCFQDAHGRILLKNSAFDDMFPKLGYKNGPATTREGQTGLSSTDVVVAVSCESWPNEAKGWSQRSLGKWPTEDMKRYIENSGCFVVPVGSKVSQMEPLEWRISTSMAERCLMFNLNITQIRCFVLLKMILKTYLQHPVSTYMCKTVFLRCIEMTHHNMWQEKNLLTCLTVCLQALYSSVLHKNCPQFFIPGNNLMARQFSPQMRDKLLKSIHYILEGQGAALYGIEIDELGKRLEIKMNQLYQSVHCAHLLSEGDESLLISGSAVLTFAANLNHWTSGLLKKAGKHLGSPITVSEKLARDILNALRLHKKSTNIERKALQFLVQLYCSSLGSVLASVDIGTNHSLSPEALNWLSAGLNSDVSSGRLKLASVLYCAGDMLMAELILKKTEQLYHFDSVEFVCRCYFVAKNQMKRELGRVCYNQNEKAVKNVCAFCVKFFPAELNCIPCELQYELFRSTKEERQQRDESDLWMDMAVVDSLPFLYYLQYKTYGNLQRYNDQHRALRHLALTINFEEKFGHRETALNLLGQCMEQENRLNDALVCYIISMRVRERDNVARFHLCRLLAEMQNNF